MNTKEKIELSRLIVEKVGEVSEVLEEAMKEGLEVAFNSEDIGNENILLKYYLFQTITYADTTTKFLGDEFVYVDKASSARLILERLNEKQEELNELVIRANCIGITVFYTEFNPMNVEITETITYLGNTPMVYPQKLH